MRCVLDMLVSVPLWSWEQWLWTRRARFALRWVYDFFLSSSRRQSLQLNECGDETEVLLHTHLRTDDQTLFFLLPWVIGVKRLFHSFPYRL